MFRFPSLAGAAASCLLLPHPAAAQTRDAGPDILVTGERDDAGLDRPAPVASRTGLTARETPATIDSVTRTQIEAKGLRSAVEIYDSVPGVVAGLLPGEPASATIRGFSTGAVSYLFDGMRVADSAILNRNYDSFNFERVEVLKGPASILYGDGALAGAINLVPRKPDPNAAHIDALASYGSFDTVRLGAGLNLPLGGGAAVRSDLGLSRSDGYVADTRTRTIQSTNSLLLAPAPRLTILLAIDAFQDRNRTPYQGVPLVPAAAARDPSGRVTGANRYVLDRAMRDENYNVLDGRMDSDSVWGRGRVAYDLGEGWLLTDEAHVYHGKREWENSEDFTFDPASGLLDRTTTKIWHDHDSWSNRGFLTGAVRLAGLRNRINLGAEYNRTRFTTLRRFGETSPVTLIDPIRGLFPIDTAANYPGTGNRANFTSRVSSWALFAEDAVDLSDRWLVLGGLRYDRIALRRQVDDLNAATTTRFGRNYSALSGRFGSVYSVTPATQLYAQYSHAVTPVGSLLLANVVRASVDLTRGDSLEGGVKTKLLGDRLTLTAAGYWIRQSGILTRDPARPSVQVQGGVQSSRGIELAATGALSRRWSFDANGALLRARYDRLTGAGGVDLAGNRPPNVPQRLANLTLYWTADPLPLTISGAIRHVGDLYTSPADRVRVAGYTLLDAAVSYRLGHATLAVRGRNLANRFYAFWSGYGEQQVYVGAPRGVDVTLSSRF
ncbi:TonB-dependent receptor [Sphingomonas metalli]|uniref:TonB-dependent receptor n=1 Tax=Sphingomonas metalli TaxID=1779358 RepID=A0A916T004_9SPHN|nr:TonB-dependent receptor [Sphingomonas metalli]GGB25408.1 TonB-dependent receptor [Sphingomonas metalli]